jgi:hypothetical protein
LASTTDPATGEITTLRRNADGSVSTFRGTRTVEADKTERLIETDQAGRRIETVIAPDGTVTMTHSVNGKNETRTVTHPNGQLETTQRDSKGNTRTTKLNESGSLILERRNAEGKLIETVTNRPDGWREHVDSEGNVRREFEAEDGSTTIIAVDRSGNTTTTVRDAKGVEVSREVKQIGPREPGRAYFEDVLGGKDWHLVPQATRDRHANTERQALERAANRAKEAAVAARRKADDAGRAAQADALSQQRQIEWEKFKAEQAAAEKKAAALETVYQRRDAIDDAYAKGKELQRQFDEALKRGDKAEAARIMERHDRHSEEVSRLLLNSPEEAAAIKADSDERYRVASRINAQARQAAAATIAQDEKIQDAKEAATGKAQYLLTGSWMQEQTKATTRAANRERAEAVAALDLIERELKDPAISDSERDILRDQRVIAEVKKAGADAILADNGRLTAIAYGLDGLTTLSGTKAAVLVGGALIKKTVGAVGSTLAKRAAATEAAGIAGKTTVSVVDDVGIASAKSIVGRNARVEGEITRIVGSDLLPVPPQPQAPLAVTQSELTRLFTPGNNLTGAEILKKVEFLRLMHEARITLQQASLRGAPDSVVAPLRNEYERLQGLVNEIMRARP